MMSRYAWNYQPVPSESRRRLAASLRVGEVCAEVLLRRGFDDPETAHRFLAPRLAHLQDPFLLTNLEAVAARLETAIRRDQRIAVLGDYDVDGVTSTVFMIDLLRRFGVAPAYFVPRRLQEGYGMTRAALEQLLTPEPPDLLIALDCGTNSAGEVAWLRQQGIDVIIIDHHQAKSDALPDALMVNPHVFDAADAAWSHLCTVGLVFKVAHGFVKRLRNQGDPVATKLQIKEYLDLVAMGTVADLMPLTGENRILTRYGLHHLANSGRLGIGALFEVAGLELGQSLQPPDISFKLGPRINASGRLADAQLPIELLLSEDHAICDEAARQMEAFNRQRQEIERAMVDEACACVASGEACPAGIVVAGESWHPGVVGIVAGKLARQFQRPCIALGQDGDQWVGSGRSYGAVNIQEVLRRCDDLLDEWGGHPKAVGVTLGLTRLDAFRERFSGAVATVCDDATSFSDDLELAAWLTPSGLNEALLGDLDRLQPFGEGNPEPVFGIREARLHEPPVSFGQCHFRFRLPTAADQVVQGIAWRLGDRLLPVGKPLELAVKFRRHQWNGHCFPQVELLDWQCASR